MDLTAYWPLIVPYLLSLTSASGAGAAAYAIFNWLKTEYPESKLFNAPRFARFAVLILSGGIGIAAAYVLHTITGEDTMPVVAMFASFVVSQTIHAGRDLAPTIIPIIASLNKTGAS